MLYTQRVLMEIATSEDTREDRRPVEKFCSLKKWINLTKWK